MIAPFIVTVNQALSFSGESLNDPLNMVDASIRDVKPVNRH